MISDRKVVRSSSQATTPRQKKEMKLVRLKVNYNWCSKVVVWRRISYG